MMQFETLDVKIQYKVAHVALNRPEKANSLTETSFRELEAVFRELDETDEVRAIVLSGNGKHFCAGIDLQLLLGIHAKVEDSCEGRKREKLRKLVLALQAPMNAIEACRKPVIAAIHGGCIGAGLDMVAACDMRYCALESYFTIKEIDLGMVADLGTLQRLPKIMSPAVVNDLAYTGRAMGHEEAERRGLVNGICTDQQDAIAVSLGVAAEIASKSPLSIRGTKEVLLYARDHSVTESLQQIALWNAAMILSEDLAAAGMAAMKRERPIFRD